MARHAALVSELESTVGDNAVRVVVLHAPRGSGVSHVLRAFVEEVRGWGHRAEYTDAELVGVQAGGGVDALLRARLGLSDGAAADEVLAALDRREGIEPLAREFLSGALGVHRDDFETARLDTRSRWEGALSEIGRWLGQGEGSFAWVIDEAVALDAESLGLVYWLAQSARFPGLVVLSLRDDERPIFESRVKSLRMSGRFRELAVQALDAETLESQFPHTARLSRGLPLTARLLQLVPREFVLPVSLDTAVRELHASLSEGERRLLGCLSSAGGRLPADALDAALGAPQHEVVSELERRLLVRRGATTRNSGADEVWLRFPLASPLDLTRAREWMAGLRIWAESKLKHSPSVAYQALLMPLIIRGAESVGDAARASLAWELSARTSGAVYGLRRAESTATGVRRLVLARMLAEDELARGEPAQAVKTVLAAFRHSAPPLWGSRELDPVVLRAITDELERWDTLTQDEATLALELTRAEAHAWLGQNDEARRVFFAVQQRLEPLKPGAAVTALWLRLGHLWASFSLSVVGDPANAVRICDVVRARVGEDFSPAGAHAVAFMRTEQRARSAGGEVARARALADALIALTRQRGDAREECVAWSARAGLYLRDGAVHAARDGFEKSLALARRIGFRRREAMAMHSLGLTLAHLGEYGAALAAQERYLALSEQLAHHDARAWGPAGMALVYVQQLDVHRAELAITRARKAAEENQWPVLLAWTRHLSGLLKLLRHLERKDTLQLSLARADFLASLDLLEDHKVGWSEALDPAEPAACLGLTWLCAGNQKQAVAALPRARAWAGASEHSARVVSALESLVERRPPEVPVRWFDASNCVRSAELWRRIAAHLELAVPALEDEQARL